MKARDAFPTKYLSASDLNGRQVRVTIDSVSFEDVGDGRKLVAHFVGKDKALVLNKTNTERIIEGLGTDETDDWCGASIVLYPTKVDYQGKRVDAIRVDDRPGATKPASAPARKPEPVPAHDDAPSDVNDDDIPF